MKYIKIIVICSILIPLFGGCNKPLDYSEASFYGEDAVLNSPSLYKALLTTIYAYLPTDFNSIDGAMRASASDDAVHVWDLSAIKRFNDGSWSALQPLDDQWGHLYTGIRSANLFLQKSEGQTFEDLRYNDGYREMMIQYDNYPNEARFLRAFFYFELIKRYGDVPLIKTPLTVQEANAVTRTPYYDVVDFIVSECDDIIPKLPTSYASLPGAETGRATKGAALALKARTLLYAASPLHNVSNDQTKWVAAATAAKEIIDMQQYSLEGSYKNVVNNINSSELILETRQNFSNAFEVANFPVGYEGGNTGTCPTQNLVEAYEMQETGMDINEQESGFVAQNPYAGRDPRMYETILYNGATWKNLTIEVWPGGFNGPPQERATKTGYYLKKYLIESISLNPVNPTTQQHAWVVFRYGEVLLNYAEAMNEAFGPDVKGPGTLQMTASEAVNFIRWRAAMPDFPAAMSQDAFRQKLRNERRVELAFEDSRFWDIRRWGIGNSTAEIYGVDVSRNNSGQVSYTPKLVETRVWHDKMNLYPIAQNELYVNKALTQNPNW
ncbi:MAG TPA: RagB/SusD family nutrient uptake outer membrane protein [Parapedobacter sp.]|uniref:RagB/SusD family nutrient uptake outer membrane protein n=1 Tax=Parapedobacter sp. TaxID=1958893 RepID=UPI002C1B0B36|nr:RagB/SusD family nutrient uptake outer membrane protein [Parapedobacter sp.]HWK57159.1 RagB/SusD family nutrient uptake outer membrane protein [Parapedobacter sp.]